MKISNKDQAVFENLSAMLDGELSATERELLLDRLLGDQDLMGLWQRHQLAHVAMQDQLHEQLLKTNLMTRVSQSLQNEAAHFIEVPLNLEKVSPGNSNTEELNPSRLTNESWFSSLMSNKLVAGTSVAASVMFATLFTVQHFQTSNNQTVATLVQPNGAQPNGAQATLAKTNLAQTALTQINQPQSDNYASNRLPRVSLPASLVSTGNPATVQHNPETDKGEKFIWIKADPRLSQQIQEYVREHEANSTISSFHSSFTPRIRAASYQPER